MKNVFFMLLVIITSTFAGTLREEVDKVALNPSDSIICFLMKTNWRAHFDYKSYNVAKIESPSTMLWVFNVHTGKGVMHDNTPQITSIYEILNFRISDVYNQQVGETQLMITALIKSDAGYYYGIIINDNQNQIIFSGPASVNAVIREYDVESVFVGTAKELKAQLNSTN